MSGDLREGRDALDTNVTPPEYSLLDGQLGSDFLGTFVDVVPERFLGVQNLNFGQGGLQRPNYLKTSLVGAEDNKWSMKCTANVDLKMARIGTLAPELIGRDPSFLLSNNHLLTLFSRALRCAPSVVDLSATELLIAYRRLPASGLIGITRKLASVVPEKEALAARDLFIHDLSSAEFERRLGPRFFAGEKLALPLAITGFAGVNNTHQFGYASDAVSTLVLNQMQETGPNHLTVAIINYSSSNRIRSVKTTTTHLGVEEVAIDQVGLDARGQTRLWACETSEQGQITSRTVFVIGNRIELEDALAHLGVLKDTFRLEALGHKDMRKCLLRVVQKRAKGGLETVAMHCAAVDDSDSLETRSNKDPQFFMVPVFGPTAYYSRGTALAQVGIARSPTW